MNDQSSKMHVYARTLTAFCILVLPSPAQAQDVAEIRGFVAPDWEPGIEQISLLELVVNGIPTHSVVRAVNRGGQIFLHHREMEASGIVVAANEVGDDGLVPVETLEDVRSHIDAKEQRLHLDAGPSRIDAQEFDLYPSAPYVSMSPSIFGVAVSYDTSLEWSRRAQQARHTSAGINARFVVFSPGPVFHIDGFAVTGPAYSRTARLSSAATFEKPEKLRRIVVGDAISAGLDWSRSVRFGGIQIARDFSLQPALVTYPLPDYFGETAVPATVEVFIDNARLFGQQVSPGPFTFQNLPVVTGGGQATIVVRDVLGRETVQTLSIYTSARLLAKGLTNYGLDVGVLRKDFGQESWSYSTPFVSGVLRHGFSNNFTGEFHGEAAPDRVLAGVGATMPLGSAAVVSFAAAGSEARTGTGTILSASGNARLGPFNFYGSVLSTHGTVVDVASETGSFLPRLRYQVGGSVRLSRASSLNVSWIGLEQRYESIHEFLSASYTVSLGGGRYFSAVGLHDVARNDWSISVNLSLPIDDRTHGYVSYNQGDGIENLEAAIVAPANPDGGFGYQLLGSEGSVERIVGRADWIGPKMRTSAEVSLHDETLSARGSLGGALVLAGGSTFAVNRMSDAFALVDTGEGNVTIYRENRDIAVTDDNGQALVTNLVPYSANRISIEPLDFAFGTVLPPTEQVIAPRRHSAVRLDFSPVSRNPATVQLLLPNGEFPPVGAPVELIGRVESLIVGRNGIVFITDLQQSQRGVVWLESRSCWFDLPLPPEADANSILDLGPIHCQMESE